MPERPPSAAHRLFRLLLRAFPFDFRTDHGREMEQTFHAQRRDAHQEGSMRMVVRLWVEVARDVFTTAPREHAAIVRQDVVYALRALQRAPVFAGAAILTLAVGLSAVLSVFAIVNAFLLRPLPVDRPDELVSISTVVPDVTVPVGLSFPDWQEHRRRSTAAFVDLLASTPRPVALDAGIGSERVTVEMVSDNYFSLLGVGPALGRLIQPQEGRARGDAPVLVLTYEYWQSRLAADPAIVGRDARVNGRPFTIIGVAPPAFHGTSAIIRVAAYAPFWMIDDVMNTPGASLLERRDSHPLTVLGRLQPGVSLSQAQDVLAITAADLVRLYPATNGNTSLLVVPETHARPNPGLGPSFRVIAAPLAGLAGLLLLITTANVASLLMARAAGRGREVALRSALGARRGRLVRQLLTEGVVLATLASVVAVPVVMLAMRTLEQFIAQMTSIATLRPDLSLDARVVATAVGSALAAGIVSGLAPALHAMRADLNGLLKSGGRGAPTDSHGRLRAALVVMQVALSLTLLVSGGLFARSLDRARDVELGFQPDGLLLASTALTLRGYDPARRLAFYNDVRDRIAALPRVELAAWTSWPPFATVYQTARVSRDGEAAPPDGRVPQEFAARVSADYFATARVPLIAGRSFDRRDELPAAAAVAIVNQTLATRFWPDGGAIGRRLRIEDDSVTVVGVVGDGKYNQIWEAPSGMVFRPIAQDVPVTATIAVRSSAPVSEVMAGMRRVIRDANPDVAPFDVRTMRDHLDSGNAFSMFRLGAAVTGLFGALGGLLASIGLYGMIAYHVSQRTSEIGLRMALGARAGDLVRDVMARGGRFALLGIVIGALLAAGVGQLMRALLLDVSPFDPLTYASVALLLMGVALLASFVPARRATAVDPLAALRSD